MKEQDAFTHEWRSAAEDGTNVGMTSPAPDDASVPAIARRLRLLREGLGLTQAELCREWELGQSAWNQYEKAVQRPQLDTAIKIVRKTGVSLDWIYFGKDDMLPKHIAKKIEAAIEKEAAGSRPAAKRA